MQSILTFNLEFEYAALTFIFSYLQETGEHSMHVSNLGSSRDRFAHVHGQACTALTGYAYTTNGRSVHAKNMTIYKWAQSHDHQ